MKLTFDMFDTDSKVILLENSGYDGSLPHTHDFIEIIYIKSGQAVNIIDNQRMRLHSGNLVFIPIGKEHYIKPDGSQNQLSYINILFQAISAKPQLIDTDASIVYNFNDNPQIKSLLDNMVIEYKQRNIYYDEINLANLQTLIYQIIRQRQQKNIFMSRQQDRHQRSSDYINRALDFIHTNYNRQFSLHELADYVGLYEGYLQKLFREKRKTTVREYLTSHRLQNACKLLSETNMSVQDICFNVGYNDLKNFYTLFKKHFGMTPKEYRENSRL